MPKIIQTAWWQKPDEAIEFFKKANPRISMTEEEEKKFLDILETVWENNKHHAVERGF